jgi:lipopolysaccharide transport system permease protein
MTSAKGVHASPKVKTELLLPVRGWQPLDLAELWRYRELLYFLTVRDVKVRYKQTALGVAWAVIQPFFTMVTFSIFFGYLGGLSRHTGDVPYPVATFCALLPWQLFSNAMSNAGNSLIGSQNLITKVYFPRLLIPASAVLVGLIDFAVAFLVLLAMMAWYGLYPGPAIFTLPVFVLLALLASLAIGLWLSAANVKYRDVRYTIPFFVQFAMFSSPVAYPSSLVLDKFGPMWHTIYGLNPMAGVIEGFRWSVLGKGESPGPILLVSTVVTLVLLVGGLLYFRRMERQFADVI